MRKRVVTIAGGTGGYPLLKGLATLSLDITGVFSPFDTGGSSGDLRVEFGGPSWGDMRRGLQALSPKSQPYRTIAELSEYRFTEGSRLKGHSLGNLLLLSLALTEGNPERGLRLAERIYGLPEGRHILPSTFESSDIIIELEDGRKVIGGRQLALDIGASRIRRVSLNPRVNAYGPALRALKAANLIIIGPGSMYNSVLPNLLVQGIRESIAHSGGKVAFVCNTVTEARQTDMMNGSDFVKLVSEYLGFAPHFSIFSNNRFLGKKRTESHRGLVVVDVNQIEETGTKLILADISDETYVDRHDATKLAKIFAKLLHL